jgi:hypothetical protein
VSVIVGSDHGWYIEHGVKPGGKGLPRFFDPAAADMQAWLMTKLRGSARSPKRGSKAFQSAELALRDAYEGMAWYIRHFGVKAQPFVEPTAREMAVGVARRCAPRCCARRRRRRCGMSMTLASVRDDLLRASRKLWRYLPERVVDRGLVDPATLPIEDLERGVLRIVARSGGDFANYQGREGELGTLKFAILGFVQVDETATKVVVEQAELALLEDVLRWTGERKLPPLDCIYPLDYTQSGQLEHPIGLVRAANGSDQRMRRNIVKPARAIDLIVIHCSATPQGQNVSVYDIDKWHAARGFYRSAQACARLNPLLAHIGYHYVIDIPGSCTPAAAWTRSARTWKATTPTASGSA